MQIAFALRLRPPLPKPLVRCGFAAFAILGGLALCWSGAKGLASTSQQPKTLQAASPSDDPDAQLVVLAYHEVSDPAAAVMPDYAVAPQVLAAQLQWLVQNGYHFVSIDQVLASKHGRALPKRPVLLSFDDGYSSVYTNAFPLLKRFHAPALVAVVGRWLEARQGMVPFGNGQIDRQRLLSWSQLEQMQQSGLVEVASHSYDLHRGITGNPQGNSMPAVTTRQYDTIRGYETEASYRSRLRQDLGKSIAQIEHHLGRRPRVIVWPYGRYNATASAVASGLGLKMGLNLEDGANRSSVPLTALRRVLMGSETRTTRGLARELEQRRRNIDDSNRGSVSVMHVDLDLINDPDPSQVERNLQLLLGRIRAMGVNTVYLQAFADPDGNGAADALYFPNHYLPLKRDLFSHVAWEIRSRTQVRRLYAWMPVLAFELPQRTPGATQRLVTQPNRTGHLTMGYPRLSPFGPQAMATVAGIYRDLARSARFDGLLFHDDVTLSDYEDASPLALKQYKAWGLPTDLAKIRANDTLLGRWTNDKIQALQQLTLQLAAMVRQEQPQLSTARNLYAQVVLNPHAEAWYAQSLEASLRDYDFTAVMAMPQMEKAGDPQAFLERLVQRIREQPRGLQHTLFELQSTDWNTRRDIPSDVLAAQLQRLSALGVRHVGYYPDNLQRGTPDPRLLGPAFQAMAKPAPRS